MSNVPIISVVAASSGTGKTTFLEKLIKEFVERGYKVGAVKSDSHGFEIDIPGKDTWRFSQAGAKATAIIGPDKYAVIQKTDHKKDLDEIVAIFEDVDLILVEGYKTAAKPKIEVIRKEKGTGIVSSLEHLIAIVTDVEEISAPVPVYYIEDFKGVADLIINTFLEKEEN